MERARFEEEEEEMAVVNGRSIGGSEKETDLGNALDADDAPFVCRPAALGLSLSLTFSAPRPESRSWGQNPCS